MIELPLQIDVRSVKDMLDAGEQFVWLDCREADEHAIVRIEGSKLLPMNETANRLGELEPYRHKRVVVHCHHGKRSMQVTQWLRGQGFSQVQSMNGGIHLWSLLIDTSLSRY